MSDTTPLPNHNPGDTVEIDDLDHFVMILSDWHSKRVKTLEHMLGIPEGTVMTTEAGIDITLSGKFLDGFQAGLGLALMELGSLPFAAQTLPVPNSENHDNITQ
jgi:hypothetical protein